MLKWCSYCQQFIGETPPFDDFVITHGVCAHCLPNALTMTLTGIASAEMLRGIQQRLHAAGRRNDLQVIGTILDDAGKANIRAVDIMLGIIAPMLQQVGEDWKLDRLSVAGEHRFTAFCEHAFDLIAGRVTARGPVGAPRAARAGVLLMNAPGNAHSLAIRILQLWIANLGVPARILDPSPGPKELMQLVSSARPALLMVSVALAEQSTGAAEIVECIARLPAANRPKVILGGNAVKLGLLAPIAGAEQVTDITTLSAPGFLA